ncbi:hypothetical protein ACHAQH_003439 [Verticillium albo-atrum]
MSFKNVANSLVVLAAAFQGSSGAVLRGRSLEPSPQPDLPNVLALAARPNEPSHVGKDVLNSMFHGGHRVPTEVLEIVRRASSAGVAVSEEELMQLIQDVQDVEQRLSALMKSKAPELSPNDEIPEGAAEDTEASAEVPSEAPGSSDSLPPGAAVDPDTEEGTATAAPDFVVSGPIPDQLITSVVNSADPLAPAPTRSAIQEVDDGLGEGADDLETVVTSSVLAGGSGCTLTITQTFTEFIFDGPSTLETATPLPSDLEDFPMVVDDASAPSDLPADLEDFPTAVDDATAADNELVPLGAAEASASLPPSAAVLPEAAAPAVTEPPAPAEVAGQEASSAAPSADPAADIASAAPSEPGRMTLAFPGDESSGIAWRTIALP